MGVCDPPPPFQTDAQLAARKHTQDDIQAALQEQINAKAAKKKVGAGKKCPPWSLGSVCVCVVVCGGGGSTKIGSLNSGVVDPNQF